MLLLIQVAMLILVVNTKDVVLAHAGAQWYGTFHNTTAHNVANKSLILFKNKCAAMFHNTMKQSIADIEQKNIALSTADKFLSTILFKNVNIVQNT